MENLEISVKILIFLVSEFYSQESSKACKSNCKENNGKLETVQIPMLNEMVT